MRYSWWEFGFYLVVLMFVLFMQINEYPLFLIVGVVVVTILIAFIKHVFYPLVFDKRIDRLESFYPSNKIHLGHTLFMFLQTDLMMR